MKSGIINFVPAIAWGLLILVLSVTPSTELPETDIKWADKIAHFIVYAVLSFLMAHNYHKSHKSPLPMKVWSILLMIGVCYGLAIEFIQEFYIESRYGEVSDAIANSAGSVFGLVVAAIWVK